MKYFEYLPNFEYSNIPATNIMVRGKVLDYVLKNAAVYYTHFIRDGERPDTISHKYYGSVNYTWLLFYANQIFDPIFDWPLQNAEISSHLVAKCGSLEIAKVTPHHYLLDNAYVIDRLTYEDINLPASRKRIVTVYEHEHALNDKKREIKLIDSDYARQIANEMRRLFK